MNVERFRLLEKVAVQLTTVAALMVVYVLLWPALQPVDPLGPVVFLPDGNYAQMAVFVASLWALAAACAVTTILARPQGALLAALIGAGAISLRSSKIHALLWIWQGELGGLYCRFILELLLFAAAVVVAALIVALVRGVLVRAAPKWFWTDPLAGLADEQRAGVGHARAGWSWLEIFGGSSATWRLVLSFGKSTSATVKRRWGREALVRSLACLLLSLAISILALMILLRSTERGQLLLGLLVSFIAAVLIAHQVFPTPLAIVAWVAPLLAGILFYALAAVSSMSRAPQAWAELAEYAHTLPIDWLTAGCGGGLIGYWISSRIHEMQHLQKNK